MRRTISRKCDFILKSGVKLPPLFDETLKRRKRERERERERNVSSEFHYCGKYYTRTCSMYNMYNTYNTVICMYAYIDVILLRFQSTFLKWTEESQTNICRC